MAPTPDGTAEVEIHARVVSARSDDDLTLSSLRTHHVPTKSLLRRCLQLVFRRATDFVIGNVANPVVETPPSAAVWLRNERLTMNELTRRDPR